MPALLFLKGYRRSIEGLLKYRKYGVSGYFSVTVISLLITPLLDVRNTKGILRFSYTLNINQLMKQVTCVMFWRGVFAEENNKLD